MYDVVPAAVVAPRPQEPASSTSFAREAITEVEPPDSGHAAQLTAECSDRVEQLLTSL